MSQISHHLLNLINKQEIDEQKYIHKTFNLNLPKYSIIYISNN